MDRRKLAGAAGHSFLYAASHEDDNDVHLIIGRAPTKSPEPYMTMELSGLAAAVMTGVLVTVWLRRHVRLLSR
jgi:hypothetical protein